MNYRARSKKVSTKLISSTLVAMSASIGPESRWINELRQHRWWWVLICMFTLISVLSDIVAINWIPTCAGAKLLCFDSDQRDPITCTFDAHLKKWIWFVFKFQLFEQHSQFKILNSKVRVSKEAKQLETSAISQWY